MERRPVVLWTSLQAAGLALVLTSVLSFTAGLEAPQLIDCVFHHRANVTCKWTPGDSQTTHYTLIVQRITLDDLSASNSSVKTFTGTTSDTSCTVDIEKSSVTFNFCISITAHSASPSGNVTSNPRCQSGKIEMMLPPTTLNYITPVVGKPRCLTLNWNRSLLLFPVSKTEIEEGKLDSEIEFKAQGQPGVQVSNVTVAYQSFVVCLFKPDTVYNVRLRHRYLSWRSPWSPWSNACQGRTVEDAPSAAPMFWRQEKEINKNRSRLTSLLWKPLPHSVANGRVLFYNVTCQAESGELLPDNGNCRDLDHSQTSCSVLLPRRRCSCALSASTSAGTSPKTWIWLSEASETELPSLSHMTVTALDDNSLRIHWSPPSDLSLSGFVVEWFVVRQKNNSTLHWERLNGTSTMTNITEGVEPFKRYAVSVRALYGHWGAGQSKTEYVYTRQGAPSAGPKVWVKTLGSSVKLSWTMPVEDLHGFIQNYTLYYKTTNQPAKRVDLPGDVEQYSLQLSPGYYEFFIRASTEAGAGVIGASATVHIVSEEISVVLCVTLPLSLISLVLVLMGCVAQNKLVKETLCQDIPDPSNSSLAHWSPKSTMTSMKMPKPEMKYSEVVLLSECETDSAESDPELCDKYVCYLQTYSSPVTATSYNTLKCDSKYTEGQDSAKTKTGESFTSCPSIYSTVQISKTLPTSVLQQCTDKHHSSPSVYNHLQLGGANELCVSQQDTHLKGSRSALSPQQSPEMVSHPLLLFSQERTVQPLCVVSPQHLLTLNHFTSVPLLQYDTFTQTEPLHQNASISCFFNSVFIDLSQSTMECDPYLPA